MAVTSIARESVLPTGLNKVISPVPAGIPTTGQALLMVKTPYFSAMTKNSGQNRKALPAMDETYFFARNPASFMSSTWSCSFFATQSANSLPAMKVWLKAPSSMNFFHSGVSRTFLNKST